MTEAELNALRDRWRLIRPGDAMTLKHLDDVAVLLLALDVEVGELLAAKALLAEIAGFPTPLGGGIQQRCAAWLQAHGCPDY